MLNGDVWRLVRTVDYHIFYTVWQMITPLDIVLNSFKVTLDRSYKQWYFVIQSHTQRSTIRVRWHEAAYACRIRTDRFHKHMFPMLQFA